MKVLDLRCARDHRFEGWFGSEADFLSQHERGLVECPLCGERQVTRLPSAPRLNLSGAREPAPAPAGGSAPPVAADAVLPAGPDETRLRAQAAWLQAVRHLMDNTEDVGAGFAEEARRIHYGESAQRGIRGQTTDDERQALADEGIEVMSLPLPRALKGPVQ